MPELTDLPKDVTVAARDAAYVVVGLGILGIQRAQVRRQELRRRLADADLGIDVSITDVRKELLRRARDLDGKVEGALDHIDASLDQLEEQLPDTARDLVHQLHSQAREVRGQIRDRIVPAA